MPAIINSDDGVVSGSSGLKTSGGNDGITVFQQNGTESARITAAGNVGIGTSSPELKLDVAGDILINNNSYLYGENSVGSNSKLIGRASDDTLYVGDSAYNNPAIIQTGNNYVAINTNGSERARITSGGDFQFNSGYGSVATAYGCRAWVNFNGTSTVAIRASGNVTSITDNGTGDYTVNFTTAMPDANYTLTASAGRGGSGTDPRAVGLNQANPTTSAARITVKFVDGTAGLSDVEYVCCSFFR